MCGIFGFNWNDGALLEKGLREMKHRGPDYTGKFLDSNVSLGHNRLSIIDLSKSGNQPMSNESKDIWIIFNGEIYNFKELKQGLKQKHEFKSNSDTEVLIHLYEEEGENMINKIWGMFSFCIYDWKKKILFLARDRVGIKPLYYYKKNKDFIFGSEIKGMLKTNKIERKLNLDALSNFLVFRANTLPESFIKGVNKLPPGHRILYDLKKNKIDIKRYWETKTNAEKKSEGFYKKELLSLLDNAVKIRLVSDVPYGAYLSGGVDSGVIVSLMKKYSSQPIKTFSVGFKEDEHSELSDARFLAEKLGTDHHELMIDRSAIKSLPDIVYQCDEPIADPTIIPTYFLAKYNKKYSTVILTGEGADELFAGYPQYKFMKLHSRFARKLPKFARRMAFSFVRAMPKKMLNKFFSYASALGDKGLERFSRFLLSNNFSEQYFNQTAIFNEEEQNELLNKKVNIYERYSSAFSNGKKDIISCCQELDFNNQLVEDLLMKVDKSTMAFGVEARVPFLDHRIVELAAKIPAGLKLNWLGRDKHILRQAVREIIPKQTMMRKKRHFFVPIDLWLDKELNLLTEKFLSREYVERQGIFNYAYIEKMRKGFNKSKLFYSRQLWALLTFQIWYRQYIKNEKVKI